MTDIFKTLQDAALIQQSGGGTGFNFSHLRPRGDRLANGGTASGPVSFMKIYETATDYIKQGGRRRGANMGIIAPTGSISIIANPSSSIEPLFALAYNRKNVLDNQELTEVNELFISKLKEEGLDSDEVMAKVREQGSAEDLEQIPVPVQELFKTSLAIVYQTHIKHRAVFQQYTDNAVSKTINLAGKANGQDVENAYFLAWERDCKGITIFRNRSKDHQVLHVGAGKHQDEQELGAAFEGCMYCGE